MRAVLASAKVHCCENFEIFCPDLSKEELKNALIFLYSGEISCKNIHEGKRTLFNLIDIFGLPPLMDLDGPKIPCRFCSRNFSFHLKDSHIREEIENVLKICRMQIKAGARIVCQVCDNKIHYKDSSNPEDVIRNHYIQLHSEDIFTPKKQVSKTPLQLHI